MSAPAARSCDRAGRPWLAVLALLATGLLVGAAVPMVRIADLHGIGSLPWVIATSGTASLLLLGAGVVRRAPLGRERRHLLYYLGGGLFSIALPNVLLFAAVRALGAGIASLAYALPPLLTLALAVVTRSEHPTPRRVLGVLLGLAGTLAIIVPRRALPEGAAWSASLLVLLVPLSIAIGNLIRARLWPPGSEALPNAAGTTAAGASLLACVLLGGGDAATLAQLGRAPLVLVLAQGTASALAMVLFFWLQKSSGLIFTSQVGYVATAAGLGAAALLFDEHLSPWVWAAALLIALGVIIGRTDPHAPSRLAGRRTSRGAAAGAPPAIARGEVVGA